jgi:hypothetical protein
MVSASVEKIIVGSFALGKIQKVNPSPLWGEGRMRGSYPLVKGAPTLD